MDKEILAILNASTKAINKICDDMEILYDKDNADRYNPSWGFQGENTNIQHKMQDSLQAIKKINEKTLLQIKEILNKSK